MIPIKIKLDPNAKVIWGARMAPELTGVLQVMIIVTGVKSHQIIGNRTSGFIEDVICKNEGVYPNLSDEFFNIKQIELI